MDSIVAQAKELASISDYATKRDLVDTLRNLATTLEEPGDAVRRLSYAPVQLAVAKIATDLNLWNAVCVGEYGHSTQELAETVGADSVFLGRILRYLASFCMVEEISENTYGPSNLTKALTNPGLRACVNALASTSSPGWQELPEFVRNTQYKNPSEPNKTAFQQAFKTEKPFFQFLQTDPWRLENFCTWMSVQREGIPPWLNVYPFEKECKELNLKPEDVMFVDVGGNIGHQSRLLKETFPNLPGRVINEDLAITLQGAAPCKGVENITQNFFEPQAIKGAKYYYLRNIFHDWPDDECRDILKELIQVMAPDTRILIDELVLPNAGVRWQAAVSDIAMMSSLSGMERNERQWIELIESVGLKVDRMVPYAQPVREVHIIVAVK